MYLKSINVSFLFATILFTCLSCNKTIVDTPEKQLNFIIIFADDLGYGDLSSFGHPSIMTPNLDRMAMEGQKWTNFYVGASVCTPSRAALITGRLPIRNGMMGKKERVFHPDSQNGIPSDEITIAEQLKKANYATYMVGKWHLGHRESFLPTQHGFDFYYGIPYSNDMDLTRQLNSYMDYWELWTENYESLNNQDFNVPIMSGTQILHRPADQHNLVKTYTDQAIEIIENQKNQDKPFFLYLAHNLPHVPLFASDDFKGTSKRGLYGDAVEEIDFNIGRIIKVLKDTQQDQNTIVVFTSDNGPWLPTKISGGSAGLLKNGKGTTWEGGMREPTIFWGPSHIVPGIVTDMGTTMDLFATFSSIAGIEMPADREMDGVDLSPVLFKYEKSPRNEVYYYRERELYAIRVGSYKAHFITKGGYGETPKQYHNPPLLYNINQDPSEQFNIAKENPKIIEHINNVVKKHQSKLKSDPDLLDQRDARFRTSLK